MADPVAFEGIQRSGGNRAEFQATFTIVDLAVSSVSAGGILSLVCGFGHTSTSFADAG